MTFAPRELASTRSPIYHPLANLLNELGKPLKPKVRCILNLKNRGAGIPDGGFFTAEQLRKRAADEWLEGQIPNRGVLEVKGTGLELVALAGSEQVARYLQRYGLILITNLRDFAIVGRDAQGVAEVLEEFRLAESEAGFWHAAAYPRTLAETHGPAFAEFLTRALLQAAEVYPLYDDSCAGAGFELTPGYAPGEVVPLRAEIIVGHRDLPARLRSPLAVCERITGNNSFDFSLTLTDAGSR